MNQGKYDPHYVEGLKESPAEQLDENPLEHSKRKIVKAGLETVEIILEQLKQKCQNCGSAEEETESCSFCAKVIIPNLSPITYKPE